MSRGISSTAVVGAVIVLVAFAAVGGYFLSRSSATPSNSSTGSTTSFVGLTKGSTSSTVGLPPAGKYVNVTIAAGTVLAPDPVYSPATVTLVIGVNNTVAWTNTDRVIHSVTADDSSFTSGLLSEGMVYIHQFNAAGTFAYHDGLRPTMHGTVVVKSG